MSSISQLINKLGQLMTLGGALMAALLDHFNNNAAAYSVLVGFIGLGITVVYHIIRIHREGQKHKWLAEEHEAKMSLMRRGQLVNVSDTTEGE